MIFNGEDFQDIFIIASKGRDILPAVTNVTQESPGMIGNHFTRDNIGPREISVEVTIEADTREELREKILTASKMLYTAEPKPLKFKDEGLTYYAKLDGPTDLNEILNMGEGTINFICPNPYKHGESHTEGIGETFDNEGTYTPFVLYFELTEATESLEIELNGDKVMELIDNFESGDLIEIDTDKRTVTKNGENNKVALTIDSDFKLLKPGENEIAINPADYTGGEITYIRRWL